MHHPARFRRPHSRDEEGGGAVGKVHDHMVRLASVARRQLGGISLQDLNILDPIKKGILPQAFHCNGILVHGHHPGPLFGQKQSEGPHPGEHVQDIVPWTDQPGHAQPLRAQPLGKVGALQVNLIAQAVLLVNGAGALLSRNMTEAPGAELSLHIGDGSNDRLDPLACSHYGRSHCLGIALLHQGDVSHHLKAGAVAQDVLWRGRPLFGRKIHLDRLNGGDPAQFIAAGIIHIQDRKIDISFIRSDLAAAIQKTALHQSLSHPLPVFSPDTQT